MKMVHAGCFSVASLHSPRFLLEEYLKQAKKDHYMLYLEAGSIRPNKIEPKVLSGMKWFPFVYGKYRDALN